MKNLLLILALLVNFQVRAQEDLEPREIQEFNALSLWLPFHIGIDGKVSFLKTHPSESFVFSPVVQIGVQWKKVKFQPPMRVEGFSLEKNDAPDEWLEVYRRRLSLGVGIGALLKKGMNLGLIPFKGSKQRLVRKVSTGAPSPGLSLLPRDLREISEWNIGDQGSFEAFGGIQFQLSASTGLIDLASVNMELQSEFLLKIKKISESEVSVGVFEGSTHRRRLSVGPLLANFTLGNFEGKRFGAEFILDLARDEELFQKALDGKLSYLQETLPHVSQRVSFFGHSSTTFFGIPEVIGKNIRKGVINITEDGEDTSMHFRSSKNDGILLPKRENHRFTYLSEKETVLFWASEMSKVKGKVLDKYFVSIGRRLGLRDFQMKPEKRDKFGNVLTQLGFVIANEEIPLLQTIDLKKLEDSYASRCEKLRLNCRKASRRGKVLRSYAKLMKLEMNLLRKEMGKLFMKNPALIHAVFKTLRKSKEAYYLFLSDRFRSQEGRAEVLF